MSFNSEQVSFDDWRAVKIAVKPLGKAPIKYGVGTLRFGSPITLGRLLPRHGWEILKKNASHIYAKPPSDIGKPPFILDVRIPSRAQVLEIAKLLIESKKSWAGLIGDWLVLHLVENKVDMLSPGINEPDTHLGSFMVSASVSFGDSGLWHASVDYRNGEYHYFGDRKIDEEECA